ncbi:MAG: hypothetical protein WDL87_00230 [Candidatus Omnitrophota bacterium]|jgi:hypothetical protein
MKPNAGIVAVTIAVLIFFCGCASFTNDPSSKTQGLLEPSAAVRFSDIPVPAGFKLTPKDSYSFEATGVRVGVLRYQGKADPDQVVNFYKEQMAMCKWDLLNIIEYGQRVLNFDRETETCIVNVSAKGNAITITVSFGPKSQAPVKAKTAVKDPIK